MHWNSDPKRV